MHIKKKQSLNEGCVEIIVRRESRDCINLTLLGGEYASVVKF